MLQFTVLKQISFKIIRSYGSKHFCIHRLHVWSYAELSHSNVLPFFSTKWSCSLPLQVSMCKLCTNSCVLWCIFAPAICSNTSLLSHSILALKLKFPAYPSPLSSVLLSPAYDEQWQALLWVLWVWHHHRWQAEALADWGEDFNMLVHTSKIHIQGIKSATNDPLMYWMKNKVFFGSKTLAAYFSKP